MQIIGRTYEKAKLQRILTSNTAEFVAVYGRRRVGKTYLIREFFATKPCFFFRTSGIHKGSLKKQLAVFKQEIENTFYQNNTKLADFNNWHTAFAALTNAIDFLNTKQKVVIFLDEIPWLATPKSGLLEALDYYWNRYWSSNAKIKLIICGSAASWLIANILHDTGGLHNRVTLRLPIEPFNLSETKAYLSYKHINYNEQQILTLYMCLGGIPYYLNFIEPGLSAIQNINNICFQKRGTLYDEFDLLFASLFKQHEQHEAIINLIASKREGMGRQELESKLQVKGGRLTIRLKELEEAGFILGFTPHHKERGIYYKIIDEYTLFYLNFIAPKNKNRINKSINDHYWEVLSNSASWKSWSGYAFEAICFKHLKQIKEALHIPDGSESFAWRDKNAQIDLVFERPDNIITLCEIKYNKTPFVLDKNYAELIQKRANLYSKATKTTKQIFLSLITANGYKENSYAKNLIAGHASLGDLFKA